jgi:hypothetical protein
VRQGGGPARILSRTAARAAALAAAALALVALTAPVAPAQQFKLPKVELDYDKDADFKAFASYGWKDAGQVAEDPAMHARIVWYVERELEKKGLRKATAGTTPDLLVRYYAKKHEGLQGVPSQGETTLPGGAGQLTTGVDFRKVTEGTLLVELQRASDQKAVWTASTGYRSIDKQRIDAETKAAVRLLIAKYPPPPKS